MVWKFTKHLFKCVFHSNSNGHLDIEFQKVVDNKNPCHGKKKKPTSKLSFKTNDFIFYSVTSEFH